MQNSNPKIPPPRTTLGFLRYTFVRIWASKRLWLIPVWILLAALALVLFLSGSGNLLPAIYIAL